MIHPDTRLAFINDEIGFGVIATRDVQMGTITYVEDSLEQVITQKNFEQLTGILKEKAEIYSYRDQHGNRIISWDHAKYVNHSCSCNTISTGYGFEIAIKDIKKGDQITDEYGLFNMESTLVCGCGSKNCRDVIRPDDIDHYYKQWDETVKAALDKLKTVKQPLESLLADETQNKIDQYYRDPQNYISVYSLKFKR